MNQQPTPDSNPAGPPQRPEDIPQQQPPVPEPVAYDSQGRPLYAHPPVQQVHQVVQQVRPLDPPSQEIPEAIRKKHEDSKQKYPHLNLSEGEFVIKAMRRHPIGLFFPMFIGVLLLTIAISAYLSFDSIAVNLGLQGDLADPAGLLMPLILFCALVGVGMFIIYYVYVSNRFFLTNESVIQEIQHGLFSRHEQTVSLSNIEDASYRQTNIIQHLFNYGSIRLSTEGDETTYRFTYVANPHDHISVLNNAVEAFKLGRPVGQDGDD